MCLISSAFANHDALSGGLLGLRRLIILDALDIGFVFAPVEVTARCSGEAADGVAGLVDLQNYKPLIANKNLASNFKIEAVGGEASSLPKHCRLVSDTVRIVVDPAVISGNNTRVSFESNR